MTRGILSSRRSDYTAEGLLGSLFGHLVFLGVLFLGGFRENNFDEAPVYSVSLEGGKTLGGISQVGDGKKSPVAPPKNVGGKSAKEQKEKEAIPTAFPTKAPVTESKPTVAPPTAAVKVTEPPKVKDDKNTVKTGSLTEKATPKPTPSKSTEPTPKATIQPKPSVSASPAPSVTQKAKPTPEEDSSTTPPPKKGSDETGKSKSNNQSTDPNDAYQKAMQRYLGESTAGRGQGFGAGKLGGNSMGGGEQRPPEFFRYRDLLMREVKQNWQWFDSQSSLVARVEMKIAPDGRILAENIVQSSGDRSFDLSVLRAVRKADPLPPPPANVYQYFGTVTIVFDPNE